MSDAILRKNLIRLAHEHPEFRADLLPLLKEAGDFPPASIGKKMPGGSAEGVKGKGTVSDAGKPWMGGEFTQQENVELLDKQEKGKLSDGKADALPEKVASDAVIRSRLIRLAHEHPEFRKDLLPLLREAGHKTAGRLTCDMEKDCKKPVSHIDNKGYTYCSDHAATRKSGGVSCRKLKPTEIKKLEDGETISY